MKLRLLAYPEVQQNEQMSNQSSDRRIRSPIDLFFHRHA